MKFLNSDVRQEFHLLTLDRQREFIQLSESFAKKGKALTIIFVDRIDDKTSEVFVRLDEEFEDTIIA